jgi:hypothetical protein
MKERRKTTVHTYEVYQSPVFVDLLRCLGNDSQPGGPVRQPHLTYRPVRQHRLAESIPWNRFLGSLKVYKFGHVFNTFCYILRETEPNSHVFLRFRNVLIP